MENFLPGPPEQDPQIPPLPATVNTPQNKAIRDIHLPENWNQSAGVLYSCMLTSVPDGGELTWEFDPDPYAIYWNVGMQTQINLTRGGQVTYPKYRNIGPLIIMGQLRTRYDLLQLGFFIQEHHKEAQEKGKALHFIYPERDVDFIVYITQFPRIGINTKEEGDFVKQYQIVCDITRDHVPLESVPYSELGIPENVEWIDSQRAAEIAESKFPGSTGGLIQPKKAEDKEGLGEDGEAKGSEPPGDGKLPPLPENGLD